MDVPLMEGLGNTACSLECLACLNHVHGWTIWSGYGLCLKPRFLATGSLCKLLGDVRLDLGFSGSLNSNSTRARTSLVPKPLPSCDAFASDWSIRVLLDQFLLLPCIVPTSGNQRDSNANRLSNSAYNNVDDGLCTSTATILFCASLISRRALAIPYHSTIWIDLTTHL